MKKKRNIYKINPYESYPERQRDILIIMSYTLALSEFFAGIVAIFAAIGRSFRPLNLVTRDYFEITSA